MLTQTQAAFHISWLKREEKQSRANMERQMIMEQVLPDVQRLWVEPWCAVLQD